MNQKTETDPLTAHFFTGLFHSLFGEKDQAKSHFDAAFEYFKVRHLRIRMC